MGVLRAGLVSEIEIDSILFNRRNHIAYDNVQILPE
jgi:hypothetical protein